MKSIILMKKVGNLKKKGFTLIEVIVAVTIVIILGTLAVPKVSGYIGKAMEAKVTSAGKQIFTATMWSYTDNGDKFDGTKVQSAVENTSNVKLNTTDPVTVGSDSKSVTINFVSDKKDYTMEIDGESNKYTITSSDNTFTFDSSK